MTQVTNIFEGGTDGVTITTGNSGGISGDAFNSVGTPAGATLKYSSLRPYSGQLSMQVRCGSTGNVTNVVWTTALGILPTDHYIRFFIYMDVLASLNEPILHIEDTGIATHADVRLFADGHMDIRKTDGSQAAVSTMALVARALYRIEVKLHTNVSAGYCTLRIYADPTAAVDSYTEEVNGGGSPVTWAMTGGNPTDRIEIGYWSTDTNWPSANPTEFAYFDDLVAGATDWVGPLQILRPDADIATDAWNTPPLFSDVNDGSDATIITNNV